MKSDILTEREIRRYIGQIDLPDVGIQGQEKFKKSKILIIGTGGKGTSVAQNLAASGVGNIGLCDNFIVEEGDLARQRLYGSGDLGKQKAIISKQKLTEINHYTNIEIHNICLAKSNILNIVKDYDLFIDATNNFDAHYLINDAAITLDKPVIYGSVFNSNGIISVFNYKGGPTFRCLFPSKPSDMKKPELIGMMSQGILAGIVGSIMAHETLKVLLERGDVLSGEILTFNIPEYKFTTEKLILNPENLNFKL